MLNPFPPIVAREFVLIMCPSFIKVHPHWKMGMASPLNSNTTTIHGFFRPGFPIKKYPKVIGVKKTTPLI
jgi:hypothetical protein